jgi:hypothetical protein
LAEPGWLWATGQQEDVFGEYTGSRWMVEVHMPGSGWLKCTCQEMDG